MLIGNYVFFCYLNLGKSTDFSKIQSPEDRLIYVDLNEDNPMLQHRTNHQWFGVSRLALTRRLKYCWNYGTFQEIWTSMKCLYDDQSFHGLNGSFSWSNGTFDSNEKLGCYERNLFSLVRIYESAILSKNNFLFSLMFNEKFSLRVAKFRLPCEKKN